MQYRILERIWADRRGERPQWMARAILYQDPGLKEVEARARVYESMYGPEVAAEFLEEWDGQDKVCGYYFGHRSWYFALKPKRLEDVTLGDIPIIDPDEILNYRLTDLIKYETTELPGVPNPDGDSLQHRLLEEYARRHTGRPPWGPYLVLARMWEEEGPPKSGYLGRCWQESQGLVEP